MCPLPRNLNWSREGNRVLLTEIVVAEGGSTNPPASVEVDTVRSYELIVRLSKEDLAKVARGDWISCTWGLMKDRRVQGVRRYKDSERVNVWNPMGYAPVDVY